MATIYERIGGKPAVDAAVDIFYNKVMLDARVNYWFSHMDMQKQKAKQATFLTMAFGGPSMYSGHDMYSAHLRLIKNGLTDLHFDVIWELLELTLHELNVPQSLIDEIDVIFESQRELVLCRVAPGQTDEHAWTKYILTKREELTPLCADKSSYNVRLTLDVAPGESNKVVVRPGEHVRVGATIDGHEVVRSHTPQPSDSGLVLVIKVYTAGTLSKHLGSLSVGELVKIRGPYGHYIYAPNSHSRINMIICGSGITPIFQVVHAIANNPQDTTRVRLLYGNKSESDIALKEELDQLAAVLGDRLQLTHALSEATPSWDGTCGRIDSTLLKEYTFGSEDSPLNLICGTNLFASTVRQTLQAIGHSDSNIIVF